MNARVSFTDIIGRAAWLQGDLEHVEELPGAAERQDVLLRRTGAFTTIGAVHRELARGGEVTGARRYVRRQIIPA